MSDDLPQNSAVSGPPPNLPEHLQPPAPGSPASLILAAARTQFAEHGFAGTSTRAIAQSAGVNLAMIHYYFGNKERLYRRVVEQEFLDLHRIIAETLGAETSPQEILSRIPVFALKLHRDHPQLRRMLLREMADGAPHLATMAQEMGEFGPRGLMGAMLAQIRRGQEMGLAAGIEPVHLLAILVSVGNGLQAFAPLFKEIFGVNLEDEPTLAALGDTVQGIFQRALAPRKES